MPVEHQESCGPRGPQLRTGRILRVVGARDSRSTTRDGRVDRQRDFARAAHGRRQLPSRVGSLERELGRLEPDWLDGAPENIEPDRRIQQVVKGLGAPDRTVALSLPNDSLYSIARVLRAIDIEFRRAARIVVEGSPPGVRPRHPASGEFVVEGVSNGSIILQLAAVGGLLTEALLSRPVEFALTVQSLYLNGSWLVARIRRPSEDDGEAEVVATSELPNRFGIAPPIDLELEQPPQFEYETVGGSLRADLPNGGRIVVRETMAMEPKSRSRLCLPPAYEI